VSWVLRVKKTSAGEKKPGIKEPLGNNSPERNIAQSHHPGEAICRCGYDRILSADLHRTYSFARSAGRLEEGDFALK
jgi:hypothetical protein